MFRKLNGLSNLPFVFHLDCHILSLPVIACHCLSLTVTDCHLLSYAANESRFTVWIRKDHSHRGLPFLMPIHTLSEAVDYPCLLVYSFVLIIWLIWGGPKKSKFCSRPARDVRFLAECSACLKQHIYSDFWHCKILTLFAVFHGDFWSINFQSCWKWIKIDSIW